MSKAEIVEYLSRQKFFEGLDKQDIDFLAGSAKPRTVKKDEVLFRFDAPADSFFIVESGQIALEVAAIEGPSLKMQHVGPGALIGWSWLIRPYRWAFQGRAEEDSELHEFDGRRLREYCEENPKFGYELISRFAELMSERLMFARQAMIDEWAPMGFA